MKNIRDYVENELQPKLQGDGGWIEFVSFENGVHTAVSRGDCSKCLLLERCLSSIECEIQRDLGVADKVRAVRKQPYFQDV